MRKRITVVGLPPPLSCLLNWQVPEDSGSRSSSTSPVGLGGIQAPLWVLVYPGLILALHPLSHTPHKLCELMGVFSPPF